MCVITGKQREGEGLGRSLAPCFYLIKKQRMHKLQRATEREGDGEKETKDREIRHATRGGQRSCGKARQVKQTKENRNGDKMWRNIRMEWKNGR